MSKIAVRKRGRAVPLVGKLFLVCALLLSYMGLSANQAQAGATLPTGTWKQYGGTNGSAPGEFEGPFSLAVDRNNNLFVADTYNNRIQRLDALSGEWSTWGAGGGILPGEFNLPMGVAVDDREDLHDDMYLYAADSLNNRLQRLENGYWSAPWGGEGTGSGFNSPAGLAIDGNGNLYVADRGNHRIQKWDASLQRWSLLGGRSDCTPGSALSEFDMPTGVAVDINGNVYVTDMNNNRIQKWDALTGEWSLFANSGPGQALGKFDMPTGIAVDRNGNVYVGDSGHNRVQKWNAAAQRWTAWGKEDLSTGTALGEFNFPIGVAIDLEGKLYVADSGNHRIQVLLVQQAPDFEETLEAQKGTQAGTTKLTGAAAGAENHLVVQVSSVSISRPNVGDMAPTSASVPGLIDPYIVGDDISGVDATTNKYVVLYEVDSAGKVVKFSQIELTSGEIKPNPVQAPDFEETLTAQPGTQTGTTRLTGAAAGAGNHLAVQVSTASISRPNVGDLAPTGASVLGLIDPYIVGDDISGVDATTNKYVVLYEVDSAGKVVKFSQIELTSGEIKESSPNIPESPWTRLDGGGATGLNVNSSRNGYNPDLVVYNNVPYMAWGEFNGITNQIRVKKFEGGEWISADGGGTNGLNVNASNQAYNPKLIIFNNALYATWTEGNGNDAQIRIKRYDGMDWTSVEGEGANGLNVDASKQGWFPDLAVYNNDLYAVWSERYDNFSQIRIKKYDGTSWTSAEDAGTDGLNVDVSRGAYNPKLLVYNGALYATWAEYNETASQIRIKKYDGTSWTSMDGGGTNGLNFNTSKTADFPILSVYNNALYVAWVEKSGSASQIRIKKYDGTSWISAEDAGTNGLNVDVTQKAAFPALYAYNNALYAAWFEENGIAGQIRIKKYDGTSWTSADGGGTSGLNVDPSKLAFAVKLSANNNDLYVVWQELNDTAFQIRVASLQGPVVPTAAPDFASTLAAQPGTQNGTTKLTGITPEIGNKLKFQVNSASTPRPNVDDAAPMNAGTYTIGDDITGVDATTNKYVTLYEVDSAGKVVKFSEIVLTSGNIKSASPPGGDSGNIKPDLPSGGDSGSTPPSGTSQSDTAVSVLVNGKEENAGTATASKRNNQTVTTIAIDQKKLDAKLSTEGKGAVVTIPVSAKSDIIIAELNGQMVKNMEGKQAVVEIKTDNVTYTLPARQINTDAISDKIGKSVSLQDIKVQIEIATPTADKAKIVENAAAKGSFTLVVPPVDFTVKAVHGDTTIEVSKFTAYVERTIAIPDGVDPNKITTGVVVEADGTVRHVPTKVVQSGGKYYALINSLTNSTYSVVWHPLAFSDVATHWAKDAVNDMGSRMVIEGTGDGQFSPDREITRAEFAATVVRGLGLKMESGATAFSDVKATDWYSSAVNTAHAYGLIDGYNDGTFRPDDKITREQAMVIVAKAMMLTGLRDKLSTQTSEEALRPFVDAEAVESWAKKGVAETVQSGIVFGRSATVLAPKDYMTRAEVATLIKRLLQKSDLI